MDFLTLLRGGSSPEVAAKAFLRGFLQSYYDQEAFSFVYGSHFVMNLLQAIDLKIIVTEEDARNRFQNFQWPVEVLNVYVFMYNKFTFAPVESFLYELFIQLRQIHDYWVNDNKDELPENYMEETITPIECFTELMGLWHSAFRPLLNISYLEEPVARINFQLLRGFHYLRQIYYTQSPFLNKACDSYLPSVQLGIKYVETQNDIVTELLNMFLDDFHLYYEFSASSTDFYYEILTTECSKHRIVYKSFIDLLEKYCINYQDANNENANSIAEKRSHMVTKFMVDPKMLNLYYYTLVKRNELGLICIVLDFLNVLQSKLVSVECFSLVFIEGILESIFSKENAKADRAAKLYITIMKRLSNTENIIKHIIKNFFGRSKPIDLLKPYVQKLLKYYPQLGNIEPYIQTLQERMNEKNKMEAEISRETTAHFVVAIFKCLIEKQNSLDDQNIIFLNTVLGILKQLKCQNTQRILLDIFDDAKNLVDPKDVNSSLRTVFIAFEKTAEVRFASLENIEFPLLRKWLGIWDSVSRCTGNEALIDLLAVNIMTQYDMLKQSSQNIFENASRIDEMKYRCLLQRICLLSQFDHLENDCQSEIFADIRNGLLESEQCNGILNKYALKYKDFIDVYAMDIYTMTFMTSYSNMAKSLDRSQFESLKSKAQEFQNHLHTLILDTDAIIKEPIFRIKTIFNCYLELHVFLSFNPKLELIKLDMRAYETLVRLLTFVIFEQKDNSKKFDKYSENAQLNPLRAIEYKKLMIARLTYFHEHVKMNSNYIWHFCLYFGLPESKKYDEEILELMKVLAQHNFTVYKEMLPIIIYNLYTVKMALKSPAILNAIKAHKYFIENLPNTDRALLNVHIVLSVIDSLDVYVKSTKIKNDRNRLAALEHLHIFFEDLNLTAAEEQIKEQINTETEKLRQNLLNKVEHTTFNNFMVQIKKYIKL